jgi:PqqD family protein of HPr-rel-A system
MRWQLTPGQRLLARRFDDEFVLYNDLSGDTHLLGAAAMDLLGFLQRSTGAQAGSEDALCAALAAALDCARDAGFDAEAGAVLAQLHALALIRPA